MTDKRDTPPAETGRVGGPYYCCRAGFGETHDLTCPNFRANEPAETKAGMKPLGEAARALILAGLAKDSIGTLESIAAETKAGPTQCPKCFSLDRRRLNPACQSKPFRPIHAKDYHPWHDELLTEPVAPVSPPQSKQRDACSYRGRNGNGELCGKLRYSHPCNYVHRGDLHQFVETGEVAPVSPEPPGIWQCINCGMRIQTKQALHINDRPICVQCNAEMSPYSGESQPVSARTETDWVNAFYEAMGSDMPEDGTSAYDEWLFKRGWDAGVAQSLSAQTPPDQNVLCGAAQILDVVKIEWGSAWSEWDQSIRDGISKMMAAGSAQTGKAKEK